MGCAEFLNAEDHMYPSNDHHTGAIRSSSRAFIILILTMAMLAVTALAPVNAGEGSEGVGDDLESVRASVMETYNYKIGLLTELKNGTENEDKRAVYAEGIGELVGLRDSRVVTEDSIDALWNLKDQAHAIYNETKSRAGEVGETDAERLQTAKNKAADTVEYKIGLLKSWIEGCDDPLAREIVENGINQLKALFAEIETAETADAAYALKDKAHSIYRSTMEKAEAAKDGKDTRSDEEKAADELKAARWSTLSLIERKAAILSAAAESARNQVVAAIFAAAAEEVEELEDAARSARSIAALKEINGQVVAIYHAARDAVAELRGEDETDDREKDPAREIEARLGQIADWVDHLTEIAAATAEESPDTYEAVVAANEKVHKAIAAVGEVTESGRRLHDRWQDLSYALKTFKRAFIAHYVSMADGPASYGSLHIPG